MIAASGEYVELIGLENDLLVVKSGTIDMIHLFVKHKEELNKHSPITVKNVLQKKGASGHPDAEKAAEIAPPHTTFAALLNKPLFMHPKHLSIFDFTYDLPDEKIARYPVAERDLSKLLVYHDQQISSAIYRSLPALLPADTLLVFNNTKVVEARLYFQKVSGGTIEVFCLEPDERYADITTAMSERYRVYWKCLIGGAKKWKEGKISLQFTHNGKKITTTAEKIAQQQDHYIILLEWNTDLTFADVLHHAGTLPLPPYMDRIAEEEDHKRYQTVYAKYDGSVAAPTAGLHFTDSLLESVIAKGIQQAFVTLHVGAGTFKPVKTATMQEHDMHAEFIEVDLSTIESIRKFLPHHIVTVGTTSLRTIESLYWLGKKVCEHPGISPANLVVEQWDPYEPCDNEPSTAEALDALIQWMKQHQTSKIITKTRVIIAPGYRFRIIHALVTNFHQPQSTLLLLVAALTGSAWKNIYQYALKNEFRFLSYGDGCLLWKQ